MKPESTIPTLPEAQREGDVERSVSERKAILVVGMHRSGTSAFTRVLNVLGADLPGNLMPPAPGNNETGFWESYDIANLHDEMLADAGSAWDDPASFPRSWLDSPDVAAYEDRLLGILHDHFGKARLFVVKDPRICRFVPLWLRVLRRFGAEPLVVLPIRNPLEVAASLGKRDGFSLSKGLLLWLRHVLDAERDTRGFPRSIVMYDSLLADWRRVARKISGDLDLRWPRQDDESGKDIDDFLSSRLRHQSFRPDDVAARPEVATWVREVYAALWSGRGGVALSKKLDRIRAALDTAERAFTPLLDELREVIEGRTTELDQRGKRIDELAEEVAALRTVLGDRERILAEQEGALAELRRLLAERESTLAERNRELDELRSRVTALSAELSVRDSELGASARWFADRDAHLRALAHRLGIVEGEAHALRGEIAARDARLGVLHRDLTELLSSRSVRMMEPVRVARHAARDLAHGARRAARLAGGAVTGHLGKRLRLERTAGVIRKAGLFDLAFYLAHNPEVARLGIDPLEHYVETGADEGRLPHPFFDTRYYVARYPDVAGSGMNPLVHFIEIGEREGRDPSVRFRTSYYLEKYPDVAGSGLTPFRHYLEIGQREGREPAPDLNGGFRPLPPQDRYQCWLEMNHWNGRMEADLRARLAEAGELPALSVIMPVYDPPLRWLRAAVRSVREQVYGNHELCIADDASTDPTVRAFLDELADEPGVRIVRRQENGGISAATNAAAALATGELLVFLDHDDELAPNALAEVALAIASRPDTDMLYSDSDKVDEEGRRYMPHFKPDWSPELLLGYMYSGQVLVIRRSLFEELEGMRVGFEGSQDHDLALRAGERARRVTHIPKVLYHWRALGGSTALGAGQKPYSTEAGRKAVQEALERRGSTGVAIQPHWAAERGNSLFVHEFPDEGPSVTIIIPTKNLVEILRQCIVSLPATTYWNYKVLIVDNESDDPDTRDYLRRCGIEVLRLGNPPGGFNFSFLCNRAAAHADTDYVLFLNNDTEVLDRRWLSRMVGYAGLPGVGAVGALLRYPDGRIQHAGVVHGYFDGAVGHAFKMLAPGEFGYLAHDRVSRNYSAVTAACMLVPRRQFLERGGFDETHFGVAFNDPDYCYRLVDDGYRVVYCSGAELRHHEGISRGFGDHPHEVAEFRRRYEGRRDPYYNPNLSLEDELFQVEPRHVTLGRQRSRRVVLVSHNLNREGAPKVLFDVSTFLRDSGSLDPVVVSPRDGPLREAYEERGIPVHVLEEPLFREDGTLRIGLEEDEYEEGLRKVMKTLSSLGAEMIWANTLISFYAIDAARRLGLPSVWSIHESEGWEEYYRFVSPPVARRALDCFAEPYRVVFVARATLNRYAALNGRYNFAMIHNGIDRKEIEEAKTRLSRDEARTQLGLDDGEVMLLSMGTVCWRKGQEDLVSALEGMEEKEVGRLRVFFVGGQSDEYCRRLMSRVEGLPDTLRDRIHFVDATPDTALYYRAADLLVMTSYVESYPLVTLEAMAYELPIVTTPVFGIAEQVCDDVNAKVYPPGDVDALRETIRDLATDEAKRRRYAAAAIPVLERRISREQMCRQYGELFEEAFFSREPETERRGVV